MSSLGRVVESLRLQLGEDGWYQHVKGALATVGDAVLKGILAEAVARRARVQLASMRRADLRELPRGGDCAQAAPARTVAGDSRDSVPTGAFADRASEVVVSVSERAGVAVNVVRDKAAEYAVAAHDKTVEAANGFVHGLGTSRRTQRGAQERYEPEAGTLAPEAPTKAVATASAASYADELRLLKAFLDNGIITQEKLDTKKRQLLRL